MCLKTQSGEYCTDKKKEETLLVSQQREMSEVMQLWSLLTLWVSRQRQFVNELYLTLAYVSDWLSRLNLTGSFMWSNQVQ